MSWVTELGASAYAFSSQYPPEGSEDQYRLKEPNDLIHKEKKIIPNLIHVHIY